jgi:membrane-associated protease RseP (regulator of RpoE activity)
LRWVLAHELTHLERGDSRSYLLFGLGQALYFYCPWFWWLRRQVRLSQEYIADAAVSRVGAPEDYAQFLLTLTNAPAAPASAAGVNGKPSDLFRRITMLLENSVSVERVSPRRWSVATAVAFLALAALVSGINVSADAAAPVQEPKPVAPADADQPLEPLDAELILLENLLPDMDALLQEVPAGDDDSREKQLKELREAQKKLEEASEQLRQALRQLREHEGAAIGKIQVFPPGPGEISLKGPMRPVTLIGLDGDTARLGIHVEKPNTALADQLDLPKGHGMVVTHVESESPAAKAGLKANDILLELDGKAIPQDASELAKLVAKIKADSPVNAVVLRKGKKESVEGIRLREPKTVLRVEPGKPARVLRFDQPLGHGLKSNLGTLKGLELQLDENAKLLPKIATVMSPGSHGVFTTLFRTDDRFTARHQEGTLVITLTGKTSDGKAKVSEIVVEDAGKTHTYDSIEKVPERYRDKVKSLADMSEKGATRIEIKTP